MARTFYRIVKANPPRLDDFISNKAKGRRLDNPTAERQHLWAGLSAWSTAAQAMRSARRHPGSGSYIASLEIPEDCSVGFEKTLGPGHYTLWGEASDLRYVIAISAVRR